MRDCFSLAKAYEKYFKIGAAVSPRDLTVHHDILLQHFNSFTCENQMKYELTEPEEGQFTFSDADLIVNFAKGMGVKLRAHAPVWHMQTGEWMFRDGEKPAPKELIYERIDAHTKALAEHFNDAVYCWDVVNEAVRDDRIGPQNRASSVDPVYRNSAYFQHCGAEFIEKAFRSMEKYSPDAQLFYNDYNECDPVKRERIVTLIRTLQEKGCRIDGFGMQQHYFMNPDYDELKRSIEIYAGLGLRLHITELDVSMMAVANLGSRRIKPGEPGFEAYIHESMNPTPEKLAMISTIYERLFEIYRSYADVIDCVTTWGVADDITWLDSFGIDPRLPKIKQHPLLFDEQHQPKPCVYQMIGAVK